MAISLVKGQTIDLRKNDQGEEFDLSTVTIGLGWDVKKQPASGGFLGKLFSSGQKEAEYDLDAIAMLLDANGKVADLGRTVTTNDGRSIRLYEGDVIFFNSMRHPSGHIWLTGDNRTGAGDGDDEQIIVKLDELDQRYQKILFLVTIYQGRQNNQHFGLIENAFIRAVDKRGKEIAKFNLSGDSTYNGMCSMTFAEIYRKDGTWKFRAIGEPHQSDSFIDELKKRVYS
ncbi:Stress response protein SCP2 [Chitinophaga terrae (ex Kim and Jung 2007)]|jgi:stress response protein SCP2|uniref:Stress response protein SCP2 n=1 Tax=Chitinophaga terrae (ex Kim and Jung 2007) TaxID=408074 RepID=A0A1H4CFJ2_9BACT|nr:TerD family protein [Chitinophaga terrae (ex Kim and Jung 2007)]MDQ0109446.1 stress response protein SCP2 [Chitinophaga terrae (ex Kim and Jung 2007)]GEP88949.1 tellurium resistance protein TerX [Chitinophaga terrae (ex Kim and Jung 2007)]SEA59147.1 Stress response protein SCP2 [Chitinophaga terrae (ex Kim and Jung 2007)]